MIVVDASVAVKWFLPEVGSSRALELLQGNEVLLAPDLIRIEVASAITRHHRKGEFSTDDTRSTLHMWFDALKEGVIRITTSLDDLRDAANFSLQLNHHIHDCLYLAVSRNNSASLITADQKFAEKARSVHPAVELIV